MKFDQPCTAEYILIGCPAPLPTPRLHSKAAIKDPYGAFHGLAADEATPPLNREKASVVKCVSGVCHASDRPENRPHKDPWNLCTSAQLYWRPPRVSKAWRFEVNMPQVVYGRLPPHAHASHKPAEKHFPNPPPTQRM